jgi:hypothetical protein
MFTNTTTSSIAEVVPGVNDTFDVIDGRSAECHVLFNTLENWTSAGSTVRVQIGDNIYRNACQVREAFDFLSDVTCQLLGLDYAFARCALCAAFGRDGATIGGHDHRAVRGVLHE